MRISVASSTVITSFVFLEIKTNIAPKACFDNLKYANDRLEIPPGTKVKGITQIWNYANRQFHAGIGSAALAFEEKRTWDRCMKNIVATKEM